MPNEGVCGTEVALGQECGIDIDFGQFCSEDALCVPEDLNDDTSTPRCYQDCSMAGTVCQMGTCRQLQGGFAYCR